MQYIKDNIRYIRFIFTILIAFILCQIFALVGIASGTTGMFLTSYNISHQIIIRILTALTATAIYIYFESKFRTKNNIIRDQHIESRYTYILCTIYYIVFAFLGFIFTISFISRHLLFIFFSSLIINFIHGWFIYYLMYRRQFKRIHIIYYLPLTCIVTAILVYIFGSVISDLFYRYLLPISFSTS